MRDSLEAKMKDAVRFFKRRAASAENETDGKTAEWLTDNYYMLERFARGSAEECRAAEKLLKGSDLLPSLFARCMEMCSNGKLPDEDGIFAFFQKDGLDGISSGYLPLISVCALIEYAVNGIKNKSPELLGNAVKSLRKISETDFDAVAQKLCCFEDILSADPADAYSSMDNETKNLYRYHVALAAYKCRKSEKRIAEKALKKAQRKNEHIGKYIVPLNPYGKRGALYLAMGIIMPLAVCVATSILFSSPEAAFLLFLPVYELLRHPVERASLKGVVSQRLPRLSADDERVLKCHALLTVSTILPSASKMQELESKLEQLYLSNCSGNIKVCCLADFKAAGMPRRPEDKHILKAARQVIDSLNKKYGSGFILAVRPRSYSDTQNEFIGKERKRGAITELIRAVKGCSKGFCELYGDVQNLEQVKYLIALDWDTQPEFDSARELIAVAEHPLNAPVIKNGRVTEGYGIIAPQTVNSRESKGETGFSRLMAGDAGFATYDSASSEKYQMLFGESIFSGKGIINVDAYYKLLDKTLPRETVLSHDIIEGGYLRTAFAADIQFAEAFPQNVGSYFRRLHRWVRGDWQNIGFVFGKNPMNKLSRYKIFDNLRRSLVSPSCLFAIFASSVIQGYEGITIAVVAAIAVCAEKLFAGFGHVLINGASSFTRLYFSKDLPPALDCFVRAFLSVAFIARESFVCVDAVCKALWRLFVSGNNLLEWTTAAQSDGQKSFTGLLVSCIPSVISAAVIIIFGLPIHRLLGLIILADIPLTLFSGSESDKKETVISGKQKESLVSYASSMWSFYEDLCGKENNFLPPDNIQFSPSRLVAQRTSPTNIGLMLVSFLAARDLGFITTAELFMRLNLSLSSIEKLEKYKGNLLNWYSTVTLEPLMPRFVSTVDSGNFLCCLIALKEGLREYLPECKALSDIIDEIEKMIDETDISPLYNERKKLFYIGVNADSGKKSESSYDLYMSEIRMTAYMAVAKKLVPKNHWGAMGRIPVGRGRYTGLASWTGTVFEYFMPEIFLPSPKGSLSAEALCFCLYCHKKKEGRLPFGISESGFYAFDGNLNYQYKAHGVQNLGLKHGLDSETVISPYSSFLTMNFAPIVSIKNLIRLEKMGMTGKYGFFESADFTKGRNNGKFSIVHSFMSHHIGMSLLSLDNFLNNKCMQNRFMSDSAMKGAKSLLEENGTVSGRIFKDIRLSDIPAVREHVRSRNEVSDAPNPFEPKAAVYTNGRMTTCLTDIGTGVSLFDGADITAHSNDPIMRPQGVFAVFTTSKEKMPFVKALDPLSKSKYKAEFCKDKVEYTAVNSHAVRKMTVKLLQRHNCELRTFTIENPSKKAQLEGYLTVYFDPCLDKRESYSAHPAFSKLFLIDEWDEENGCFLFSRRSRAGDIPCAVAAGFISAESIKHESSRERVLRTPEGVFSIGDKTDFEGMRGNPDCCCAFSIKISLKPGEKSLFDFILAVDETKEQALDLFLKIKTDKKEKKCALNPFFANNLENAFANMLLPSVFYPELLSCGTNLGESCNFRKEDLWSFGISGDLPIVLAQINGADDTKEIIPYIRFNKILRSCGIQTDLAVLYSNEEEYTLKVSTALKEIAESEQCGLMLGVKGGIHLINEALHGYNQLCALKHYASFSSKNMRKRSEGNESFFRPLKISLSNEKTKSIKNQNAVKQYNFTEGEITIEKEAATVDIPWCMVYANKSFGTMVSDKALGFTWALNSRENKLTPWYNDTMSDNRGEMLFLKYNGVFYDLICLGKAEFTPEKARWFATVDGMDFEICVSVPNKGMTKKCTVKVHNKSDSKKSFSLVYYTSPVLGVQRKNNDIFFAKKCKNSIVLENAGSVIKGFMSLSCEEANLFCISKKNFFEGKFNSDNSVVSKDCCAAVGREFILSSSETDTATFNLSWGASEKSVLLMPAVSKFDKKILNPVKIKTCDNKLNLFLNSFLYSQIKQSRFFARTGFYQCSGAYGFRDQLQDCLAFIDYEPKLAYVHIIRCAAVQFEQGDVMHWWHVTVNQKQIRSGIRTRCSDDMLWLPYACIVYYQKTGDRSIFDVQVPYLVGEPLAENESERYFTPEKTNYKESILMHCIKAISRSESSGSNGLPLIGSCDWNDGLSKIGESKKTESIWLAMFQKIIYEGMADILPDFNMEDKSKEYLSKAKKLNEVIMKKAFHENKFERLIFENSETSDFLDILPQAFSVFSGVGSNEEQKAALKTAYEKLFDEENGVICLLHPPFHSDDSETVGYIASYPEGIRENSGQYTHAAVWLAMAMYKAGMVEESRKLMIAINPLSYYRDDNKASAYRAEPYVLAGDVSYGKDICGRAGWTHFTGSASWFYRFTADCAKQNEELYHSDDSNR